MGVHARGGGAPGNPENRLSPSLKTLRTAAALSTRGRGATIRLLSMTVFFTKARRRRSPAQGFAECFRLIQGKFFLRKRVFFRFATRGVTRGNPRIRLKVMRKCFNAKRSSILKIWSRRPISTSPTSGAVNPFAKLGTAPTVSSEDEEKLASMPQEQLDNYVKQQLRESIKQKGELPPTHGLPLSPLMDPKLIAARNRYRTPKPQPSGTPSALTERLQKNPYGRSFFVCLYT